MQMPSSQIQREGKYPSDWLKWEEEGYYSREQVTILAGSGTDRVLTSGMVMGKITSGGKYVQLTPGASNGSETVAGILFDDVTAEVGVDTQGVIIKRMAVVTDNGLTWASGANITTGEAALVALGILVREGA
jgi:hypothetical protein